MRIRYTAGVLAQVCCLAAVSQAALSVRLLRPSDSPDPIPANLRIVDILMDVDGADVWSGGGIRAIAEGGATLNYFDADPELGGVQPGLINGGIANQFCTSLSQPRGRNAPARFNNANVTVAGAYDPPAPSPVTTASELNVTYVSNPGATSMDGYVARISVDISSTMLPEDYATWGASPIGEIPRGSAVVLRSVPANAAFGTFSTTLDVPQPAGLNWALWQSPEPSSFVLLSVLTVFSKHRS